MGLTSTQRNGSVKKMKKSASGNSSRKRKSKANLRSTEYMLAPTSPNYCGSNDFYSSPNGERVDMNQRGCMKCVRGAKYHKPHHITCRHSQKYDGGSQLESSGESIEQEPETETQRVERVAQENLND